MNRLCMGCMKEYDDRFRICPHCGYVYNSVPEQNCYMMPGEILDERYIAGKPLDMDGYFLTYLGFDYQRQVRVLIREYYPTAYVRYRNHNALVQMEENKQEFIRETIKMIRARTERLIALKQRGCMVTIQDCFEQNGTVYLISEYLEGVTLKEYLRSHKALPADSAMLLTQNLINTMQTIHHAGLLHRNLTPGDIFLVQSENQRSPNWGNFRITGFDTSTALEQEIKDQDQPHLFSSYAPLEASYQRENIGTWSDVYSLAAILYQTLTGVRPPEAVERNQKDKLAAPSKLGTVIPPSAETALLNALNIWRAERTESMEDFRKELNAPKAKRRKNRIRPIRTKRKPAFMLAAAGGATVAVVAAAALIIGLVYPSSSRLRGDAVPNLVGMSVEEAQRALENKAFVLYLDYKDYSMEVPEDIIMSQTPVAGTRLKEDYERTAAEEAEIGPDSDRSIRVAISLGVEKKIIPDLIWLDQDEAKKLLNEMGFVDIKTEFVSVANGDPGTVTAVKVNGKLAGNEEPALLNDQILLLVAEEQLNQTAPVTIAPVPSSPPPTAEQSAAPSPTTEPASVPTSAPASTLPPGGVQAVPSTGANVEEPGAMQDSLLMINVELDTLGQAKKKLEQLGLSVGTVTQSYSNTIVSGKVISQSIKVGTKVKKGQKVDLVVSKGKKPKPAQKPTDEGKQTTSAASLTETSSTQKTDSAARETSKPFETTSAILQPEQPLEVITIPAAPETSEAIDPSLNPVQVINVP